MGGGGGGTTTTKPWKEARPFILQGYNEAQRLYESGGPQFFPGQTYISPSEATTQALNLAEQRAISGSPLLSQAQGTVGGLMNYVNPYTSQISSLGMTAADPSAAFYQNLSSGGMNAAFQPASNVFGQIMGATGSTQAADFYRNLMNNQAAAPGSDFYRSMMAEQTPTEAMQMARRTASGEYLQGNQFLEGALSRANRLATESYQEGLRGLQSQASAAGRYGSGAMGQQVAKGQDVFARALTEQNQQAYLQNYLQERAAQEAAIGRLGSMEQQAIANRFAGAAGLTAGEQQAIANQMAGAAGLSREQQQAIANRMSAATAQAGLAQQGIANQLAGAQALTAGQQQALATQLNALGAAAGLERADVATRFGAAQLAPQLAEQDFADLQRLLMVGQAREGYDTAALQDQMARWNYEQNLPYQQLQRYQSAISGYPMGTISASGGGK